MNDKAPHKPARAANGEQESPLARSRRTAAAVKLNPAFDSWLEDKLHRIFDAASVEPLPQDLVKLLDKLDTAEAENEAAKKDKA